MDKKCDFPQCAVRLTVVQHLCLYNMSNMLGMSEFVAFTATVLNCRLQRLMTAFDIATFISGFYLAANLLVQNRMFENYSKCRILVSLILAV